MNAKLTDHAVAYSISVTRVHCYDDNLAGLNLAQRGKIGQEVRRVQELTHFRDKNASLLTFVSPSVSLLFPCYHRSTSIRTCRLPPMCYQLTELLSKEVSKEITGIVVFATNELNREMKHFCVAALEEGAAS
jgi:hypothetical protein